MKSFNKIHQIYTLFMNKKIHDYQMSNRYLLK